MGLVALPAAALAQGRADTLVVVTEVGPNMLDIHAPGANRPSYQASWNVYDRLITFGNKTLKDGSKMYDYASLKPELAESWQVAPDGASIVFKLRKDAKFHDGSSVTAHDVKWSYDRAVTVGGFPTFQMMAGSLENCGSSIFSAKRGVVPVKFILTQNNVATCNLPAATISVTRTAGGAVGSIDESVYLLSSDNGSNFRIDSSACQYVYNLASSSLGVGVYRVDILINGTAIGNGVFALK